MKKTKEQKRPVHEEKDGLVKAAVWENKGKNGTFHSVTLSRLYKQGESWKSSQAFGRDDILRISKVLDRVSTWLGDPQKKA